MSKWIVAVLGLFFLQTLLPAAFRYLLGRKPNLKAAMGPRDNPPPISVTGARLERALKNMIEALLLFLPLALLAGSRGAADTLAVNGAMVFFLARAAYVPAYASGIYGLRSVLWMIGHAGIAMIAVAVIRTL
jgi:uncharacterized MAPEG superfamily protein